MIYKFAKRNGTYSEGYTTIIINKGLANIDPKNSSQVNMAKQLGGEPEKVTPKKFKKESK